MEHIELAGYIPATQHVSSVQTYFRGKCKKDDQRNYTRKIAEEMHVKGLMNMQYAIENGKVFVLEANPRASRTVPLVSQVCNIRMVPLAIDIVTSELTGKPSPVPN